MLNNLYCIWMVGLSGSGKSTTAEYYSNIYNAEIMSSDKIREELYGDENIQGNAEEVFNLLHTRCVSLLKNGFSIVYDCTNIKRKDRKKFFDYLIQHNVKPIHHAVVMCTPYNLCLKGNLKRKRQVPEQVIKRQMNNFNIPFFEEGFDYITLYGWGNKKFELISKDSTLRNITWNESSYNSLLESMKNYNQKNKHHKLDLYEHSKKVSDTIAKQLDNKVLVTAGLFHDIGKKMTQTFDDDGEAHYYNHAECGTYSLLQNLDIFDLNESEVLKCLFYINYHMLPFSWGTEKTKTKYKNIFGNNNYYGLMFFNFVDKLACE